MHTHKSRFNLNHVLLIFIALLVGVQVYVSNQAATSGEKLSQLESDIIKLEDENRNLLSENVNQMSLHELALKAEQLGYIEPEEVINFETSSPSLAYGQE
jgi:hypothetical protein